MRKEYFISLEPYQPTWTEKKLEEMLDKQGFEFVKPSLVIDQDLGVFEREAKVKNAILYYSKDFDDVRLRNKYQPLFNQDSNILKTGLCRDFQKDFHDENIIHEKAGIFLGDAKDHYYSVGIKKGVINYINIESETSTSSFLEMIRAYVKRHTRTQKLPAYYEDFETLLSISLYHDRGLTHNFEPLLPYMCLLKNDMLKKRSLTENQFLFLLIFDSALEKLCDNLSLSIFRAESTSRNK